MSSSTAASFTPILQIQIQKNWRKPSKSHQKSTHYTHFSLLIPPPNNHLRLPNSKDPSFFPSTLKLPSFTPKFCRKNTFYQPSLQSQVVLDSPPEEETVSKNDGQVSVSEKVRIFDDEPPWVNSIFINGGRNGGGDGLSCNMNGNGILRLSVNDIEREKYNLLRRRQVKEETEAWEGMVEEYREFVREMRDRKLAPNLPQVKALFLGWFEPLKKAIDREQKLQRSRKQKAVYGVFVDLLPADKMAVIVMHKMMALMMVGNETGCVRLVQAALQIGSAIEQEIKIHGFLEKTKNIRKNAGDIPEELLKEKEIQRNRVKSLVKRKRLFEAARLVTAEDSKSWSQDTQAKLGSRLIELLIETAYVQHPTKQSADSPPDVRPAFRHRFKILTNELGQQVVKRYGVIECDPLVLKGIDSSARYMVIPYVPMLIPPKNWKGYDKGGYLFLPSYVMRTHGSRKQQATMRKTPPQQMQKVFEALNTLGNTKWRINRKVLGVVEGLWATGGNVAGLVDCEDVPLPAKPTSEDPAEIEAWKWSVRKVKKINRERHALRCDVELKLSVAQKMKDEEGFYYPHNLDFRGRAYPMHPHLNHLSSDLCRGVLEFAEGRPLGKSGLRWLKIHLANVYAGGVDKLSYDERVAFVENHLPEILDSARNPINGNQWWLTAEDPFQCLAACSDLSEALKSSSPHTFRSHLPIHQDGSCNGLQHYAALGRDSKEAAAVNLVAGEKPADVYSEIAVRVREIMDKDSRKDPAEDPNAILAKALVDQVDRKLVKQTVMTSVYGVTFVGAREQIKRRLEEKGLITDDRLLFSAACYSAKVTMSALGQLFQAARGIMDWLGDCAKVIATENQPVRWTTPLGLPVVQPYCKTRRHLIKTSLQVLALQKEGEGIEAKKQRTAFPPNYVHSLDGTHMMMTAVACRDAGLQFAGVHDSFWTHACDVDVMNQILREKFVELYNTPVLEDLLESFQTLYPASTFPPLPERGNFDLEEVLESPYFFN